MIVEGSFDLEALGLSIEQWLKIYKPLSWQEMIPPKQYDHSIRDMRKYWKNISSVEDFSESWGFKNGLDISGTYALVYDPKNKDTHPVTGSATIIFGETTQYAAKRIIHTVGALKGNSTNMSSKWDKHKSFVEQSLKIDNIRNHLKDIKIWFRPHRSTDQDWEHDRKHSCEMEQWSHAFYYSINKIKRNFMVWIKNRIERIL